MPVLPSINLQHSLGDVMQTILLRSLNFDISFVVESQTFKAHRAILAVQSPVFEKMLSPGCNFAESQKNAINLPGKRVTSFSIFLCYLYTHIVDFSNVDLDTAIDVFRIAHEYQVDSLTEVMEQNLLKLVDMECAFRLFEVALLLQIPNLLRKCREFLCRNAEEALKNVQFSALSEAAVVDLISRDTFCAREVDILWALLSWREVWPTASMEQIFKQIRFHRVMLDGLSIVHAAPIYELLTANDGVDLRKLGKQTPTEVNNPRLETNNLATKASGATITEQGGCANSHCLFSHASDTGGDAIIKSAFDTSYFLVDLGRVCLVDSMSFHVVSCKDFLYSGYRISTSVDKTNWEFVANCWNIDCIRNQLLMFNPRQIRFVKISGKPPTDYSFGICGFQCPANGLTESDLDRYSQHCPDGGTLLYQRNQPEIEDTIRVLS